jgi:hypothetical protein
MPRSLVNAAYGLGAGHGRFGPALCIPSRTPGKLRLYPRHSRTPVIELIKCKSVLRTLRGGELRRHRSHPTLKILARLVSSQGKHPELSVELMGALAYAKSE